MPSSGKQDSLQPISAAYARHIFIRNTVVAMALALIPTVLLVVLPGRAGVAQHYVKWPAKACEYVLYVLAVLYVVSVMLGTWSRLRLMLLSLRHRTYIELSPWSQALAVALLPLLLIYLPILIYQSQHGALSAFVVISFITSALILVLGCIRICIYRSIVARSAALIVARFLGTAICWLGTGWRIILITVSITYLLTPTIQKSYLDYLRKNASNGPKSPATTVNSTAPAGTGKVVQAASPSDSSHSAQSSANAHRPAPYSHKAGQISVAGLVSPARNQSEQNQQPGNPVLSSIASAIRWVLPWNGGIGFLQCIGLAICLDLLGVLLFAAYRSRKLIVIDAFTDTVAPPLVPAQGIEALLTNRLAEITGLYHNLQDQTAVYAHGVSKTLGDSSIRTDSVDNMLRDIVPADAKLSLFGLQLSIMPVLRLAGRLIQTRHLSGQLYREGDSLVLTAKLICGRRSWSWRVQSTDNWYMAQNPLDGMGAGDSDVYNALVQAGAQIQSAPDGTVSGRTRTVDDMISELACRIFTDIGLTRGVRWRAARSFTEGLRAYRECLRTPRERRLNLKRAERCFMQALSDDEGFEWAYYNLGLVYTGLGQERAAAAAFTQAITQNPDRWEPNYALAQVYLQMNEERNHMWVVALSERVIQLSPDNPRGYMLLCKGYLQEAQRPKDPEEPCRPISSYIQRAYDNGHLAVAHSWWALIRSEFKRKWGAEGCEKAEQAGEMARDCLLECALACLALGDHEQERAYYWEAVALLRQAALVRPSDAEIPYTIARVLVRLYYGGHAPKNAPMNPKHYARLEDAAEHLRCALRIDTTRADIWAYLSLVADALSLNRSNSRKPGRITVYPPTRGAQPSMGMISSDQMGSLAWREFCDRTCDHRFDRLKVVVEDWADCMDSTDPDRIKVPCWQCDTNAAQSVSFRVRTICEVQRVNEEYWRIREAALDGWQCLEGQLKKFDTYSDERVVELWTDAWQKIWALRIAREPNNEARSYTEKDDFIQKCRDLLDKLDAKSKSVRSQAVIPCESSTTRALNVPGPLGQAGYDAPSDELADAWRSAGSAVIAAQLLAEMPAPDSSVHTDIDQLFGRAVQTLTDYKLVSQLRKHGVYARWADSLLHIKAGGNKDFDTIGALDHAERAVEIDPISGFERSVLGQVYADLSDLEVAARACQEARLWSPDEPAYLLEAGRICLTLASDYCDRPRRTWLLAEAATHLYQAGELYDSGHTLAKARAYFTLGQVRFEMARFEQAIYHFRIAQKLRFAATVSQFYIGAAHALCGGYDNALKELKEVIKKALAPDCDLLAEGKIATGPTTRHALLAYASYTAAMCYYELGNKPEIDILVKNLEGNRTAGNKDDEQLLSLAYEVCLGLSALVFALQQADLEKLDESIQAFQRAVDYRAHSQAYYYLALAYEAKAHAIWPRADRETLRRVILAAQKAEQLSAEMDIREAIKCDLAALSGRLDALQKALGDLAVPPQQLPVACTTPRSGAFNVLLLGQSTPQ